MGVGFDPLPKSDFPPVKPKAFETAGCRVGRSGFRVAAFTAAGEGGGGGSLSSVMEECGAVSLGQGIPFHTGKKEKRRAGWIRASFLDIQGVDDVFQWPIFNS